MDRSRSIAWSTSFFIGSIQRFKFWLNQNFFRNVLKDNYLLWVLCHLYFVIRKVTVKIPKYCFSIFTHGALWSRDQKLFYRYAHFVHPSPCFAELRSLKTFFSSFAPSVLTLLFMRMSRLRWQGLYLTHRKE